MNGLQNLEMFDRQLTDRRIAEAILQAEKLEVAFEPLPGEETRLKFTIYSLDFNDGRSFIFGEGKGDNIWSEIRARLEEINL